MNNIRQKPSRTSMLWRRSIFALLVLGTVVGISWDALMMLQVNGWSWLKVAILILFLILLTPVAFSFWTAVFGFVVQLRGGDALELTRLIPGEPQWPDAPSTSSRLGSGACNSTRTAIVVPVYNEAPARVFAGLKATYESVKATGLLDCFDFYILSDTTNPDIWVREEMAFSELCRQLGDPERIHYRNRRENTERKSGNIADFCATWGDRYTYMVVFDADSLMTGDCLVELVRLMERNPGVGIIQAPPLPVNRRSLFGRLHQFAMHAYSTIFISGLNFWQGGSANYWGHNAIIRIQPFVEHCRLPKLSGPPPLGGSILSHDFVEAAFMRRAGWKVHLASELRGSYEELPSSLIGFAARDRRWCQGNLQHVRLLAEPKLHPINRLHISMGAMSYLASPLWLLLLALTTAEGLYENLGPHHYFPEHRALFPSWPVSVDHQALYLFLLMMSLLIFPKLLSVVIHLRDVAHTQQFGGRARFSLSVLYETLFSTLLAPNLAILQARFVIGTLMGSNVKWESQDRGETGTTLREAAARHWPATAIGLVWSGLLLFTVPNLFWWFSPVLFGFLLAIPLSSWSSRSSIGEKAREHGLFLIPEEVNPPPILEIFEHELQSAEQETWAVDGDGLTRVLEDPVVRSLHLSLLSASPPAADPLRRHHLEGLSLKVRCKGAQALTPPEKRDLLLDPEAIRDLLVRQE